MKRSEMETYLAKYLAAYLDYNEPRYDIAKALLNVIEAKGMMPPRITVNPNSYNRADGTYGFEVYEWESE